MANIEQLDKEVGFLYAKVDALETLVKSLVHTLKAGFATDSKMKELFDQDINYYENDVKNIKN